MNKWLSKSYSIIFLLSRSFFSLLSNRSRKRWFNLLLGAVTLSAASPSFFIIGWRSISIRLSSTCHSLMWIVTWWWIALSWIVFLFLMLDATNNCYMRVVGSWNLTGWSWIYWGTTVKRVRDEWLVIKVFSEFLKIFLDLLIAVWP